MTRETAHRASLKTFKNKKCSKCSNKIIYAIAIYNESYEWKTFKKKTRLDFIEGLCIDHCPKMADGSPGYDKLTIIESSAYSKESYFNPPPDFQLSKAPEDACYQCGKKIQEEKEFVLQGIVPGNLNGEFSFGLTLEAIPVEPFSYWICKEGCDKYD